MKAINCLATAFLCRLVSSSLSLSLCRLSIFASSVRRVAYGHPIALRFTCNSSRNRQNLPCLSQAQFQIPIGENPIVSAWISVPLDPIALPNPSRLCLWVKGRPQERSVWAGQLHTCSCYLIISSFFLHILVPFWEGFEEIREST